MTHNRHAAPVEDVDRLGEDGQRAVLELAVASSAARRFEPHPKSVYRDILVAVDPRTDRSIALERAAALALRHGARLTMVSATGSPPLCLWLAPALPENPHHALQHECAERLRSLATTLPREISVTARLHHGSQVSALRKELGHATYDLVVLGSDKPRRRRRALSRALSRRSSGSVLVVSPAQVSALPIASRSDG
ncbi:MAG: hypothetical protein QOG42_291 [Solirubrobacteraceae bacterium]|nr:hypothetical protein [Solirubrobacteraceae bacterium]